MNNILKSTAYGVNPMIPPVEQRPRCYTVGCTKHVMIIGTRKDGSPSYRKWCATCHNKRTAAKHGMAHIIEITAKRRGFASVAEFLNTKHPYRRHRKEYCENIDGRFGFICTTTITNSFVLDVDHIDGDPRNNEPENLQTLCACCHRVKTKMFEDYRTPGRKALGITY